MRKGLIIILLVCIFIFESSLNAQENEKTKNLSIFNSKEADKECSFTILSKLFSSYAKFYPELYYADHRVEDWTPYLEGRYKCEDVRDFLMEKDKKRLSRKLDIIVPEEGITTGILIAYGNYITPPYKITADMENLAMYVNNVQVWELLRPEKVEMSEYEKLDKEIDDIEDRLIELDKLFKVKYKIPIRRVTDWAIEFNGKKRAREQLKEYLERLKSRNRIKDYKIYDEDKLLFDILISNYSTWDIPEEYQPKKKEERVEQAVPEGFEPYVPKTKEESKKIMQDYINYRIDWLSEHLKNDEVVIASAAYSDFIPFEILSNEKVIKLCEIIINNKDDYKKCIELMRLGVREISICSTEIVFNISSDDCKKILGKIKNNK